MIPDPSTNQNPILPFVQQQGVFVLDGGLATALEARGCDLVDDLWSAKILIEEPEQIFQVHQDFLRAGADCIATCSYQATLEGFTRRGLSEEEGAGLLAYSVELAVEARDAFWEDGSNRVGRLRPLVAASIGPYGAFLADGSEYTGDYGVSRSELMEFHRSRWEVMSATECDIIACETIPTYEEAKVLIDLLRETPDKWAWISFFCKDEKQLADGGRLRDVVELCDEAAQVAAVGINCVAPELVPALIDEVRQSTGKPVLVYPNSGERYDADRKEWHSAPSPVSWNDAPLDWVTRGCQGVGGCCRVGPDRIAALRLLLVKHDQSQE